MLSKRLGASFAIAGLAAGLLLWQAVPWDRPGFCTAINRSAWVSALHRHPEPPATKTDRPLDLPVSGGQLHLLPHELQLWTPDGTHRRLLTVPTGEGLGAVTAGSGWVVASLGRPVPFDGYHPFRTEALVAVRVADGRTVTVARRTGSNVLDGPWLVDGSVWWSDRIEGGRAAHRFDLRTGARTVPGTTTHLGQTLSVRPQGVGWWGGDLVSPRALPDPVERALPDRWRVQLVTDGTTYAWADRQGIRWWQPGAKIDLTSFGHDETWTPTDVSGPFVYIERDSEGSASGILDVRTGALLGDDDARGPIGVVFPRQFSGFAGLLSSYGRQQYDVVPADLPELRC